MTDQSLNTEGGWWARRKAKKEAARQEELKRGFEAANAWNSGNLESHIPRVPDLYSLDPNEADQATQMAFWTLFERESAGQTVTSSMALQSELILPGIAIAKTLAREFHQQPFIYEEPGQFIRIIAAGILYSRAFRTVVTWDDGGPLALGEGFTAKKFNSREAAMARTSIQLGMVLGGSFGWSQEFFNGLTRITEREKSLDPRLKHLPIHEAEKSCAGAMLTGVCLTRATTFSPITRLPLTPPDFDDEES